MSRRRRRSRREAPQTLVTAGRGLSTASRLVRLPRPSVTPVLFSRTYRDALVRDPRTALRRRVDPVPDVVRQVRLRKRSFLRLRSPSLDVRRSPCVRRQRRKEVLFALHVSGRRWSGGGGPQMRGARHTLDSQFTCRR